ncbi:glycosyltransferase family 2 protein [Streptomyces sp.]|uniref:glycosyltransferase family 2 protein n=1 Tax=Streptomyces sp. TaxID=1931 RepID=UPI002F405646
MSAPGSVVAFVMPYYDDGQPWRRSTLDLTLESIRRQSDGDWHVYLTDDASPHPGTRAFLADTAARMPGRMTVLEAPVNAGAGDARNRAVRAAASDGCTLLAYLDSDDVAHPDRVRVVRQRFAQDPALEFLYSDIEFIDEHGAPWESADLLPGLHLLNQQQALPKLTGRERWAEQATDRDNIAIPSAMNLRTDLALRFPFPRVRFCEDVATLFRYLGSGAKIDHVAGIPTGYRVPRQGGSSSRKQSGDLDEFNRLRCVNERAGLEDALAHAVERGVTDELRGRAVLCRYLIRIGRTVAADGSPELGREQLREAYALDPATFAEHATRRELDSVEREVGSRL